MRIIILAALMVVGVLQQRAEACPACRKGPFFSATTEVPLNARLRVLDPGDSSFTLLTQDGVVVPLSSEPIQNGVVLVPDAVLAPNTAYVLSDPEGSFTTNFRTGATADEDAPAAPVLGAVTHLVSPLLKGPCDNSGEFFSIAMPVVDGAYEVFVGPTVNTIDTTQPFMTATSNSGFVSLSDLSVCGSNFPVSKTSKLAIAIRELDLAGNASPLSAPLQLKGGEGCSGTGAPGVIILASLLTRIWAKSRRKQAVG